MPVPPRAIGSDARHDAGGRRSRRLGDDEVRNFGRRIAPVLLGHAEASSIISDRNQPGVSATDVAPIEIFVRPCHPRARNLGQVIERREPVVRRVVFSGAIGHFHEQASRPLDEQWQARDAR